MNIISKKLFIETIDALKKQYEHDEKCAKAIQSVYQNDFISGYDNSKLNNQLVKILQECFNDAHVHSLIEYYMYELDFGVKYKKGYVTEGKNNIDISTSAKLYDYLVSKK